MTSAKYQEIADHLRLLVAGADPGDRLPSDADLVERFGVSRMTARQAVQVLESERLLIRTRGKGTFVAPRPVPRLLGSPLSFTASMRRRGLRASSLVLDRTMADPSPDDVAALGLAAGERVARLRRIRLAEGVPMAIENAAIAPWCAAVLEEDLEAGSLHDAFERLGHIPTRAEAQVSARRAAAAERRLLEQPGDGCVLSERRVISDQDGIPLEHTETLYAAERYVFEAVLRRDDTDVMG